MPLYIWPEPLAVTVHGSIGEPPHELHQPLEALLADGLLGHETRCDGLDHA